LPRSTGAYYVTLFVLVPAEVPLQPWPLIVYLLVQGLRYWAMISLGPYWTTRVITVPGAPLSARGPYRFMRHPNYLAVFGGMAVLPLAFGAWGIAMLFTALNLPLLWYRIRIEEAALAEGRGEDAGA
jgi:methyltransferase